VLLNALFSQNTASIPPEYIFWGLPGHGGSEGVDARLHQNLAGEDLDFGKDDLHQPPGNFIIFQVSQYNHKCI